MTMSLNDDSNKDGNEKPRQDRKHELLGGAEPNIKGRIQDAKISVPRESPSPLASSANGPTR